jgi:hypothetical protein
MRRSASISTDNPKSGMAARRQRLRDILGAAVAYVTCPGKANNMTLEKLTLAQLVNIISFL